VQEHCQCQKPAGSVFLSIYFKDLRFAIHISAVGVSKEPQT